MNIIYLSDFNCPYSYIGLNRIKSVCNELNLDVEWEMKSFELEPKLTTVLNATERYAARHGLTVDDAKKEIEEIEKIAKNDGLNLNYSNVQLANSKNAHRLVKYVEYNYPKLTQELILKIFEANFIKNENIAEHDVLIRTASSCGLDENEISKFLKRESYAIEVDLDMDEAISNGITSTPYYFINHGDKRLIIPGVFEKKDFKIAFEDLLSGEIENKTFI
ncbi:DsbA family protein [Methanobrevibacter sp.]|uniref:DsbA family oxidoreductase n=1 Tax=Methanobrevibacter sp. TaxID=66852 RepID=UPI0026DF8575|nr:DsbA family protein [Methanobrevibacter sp.]MDO5823537.1 DsbA family protein [Methanobrevibacter sp.]